MCRTPADLYTPCSLAPKHCRVISAPSLQSPQGPQLRPGVTRLPSQPASESLRRGRWARTPRDSPWSSAWDDLIGAACRCSPGASAAGRNHQVRPVVPQAHYGRADGRPAAGPRGPRPDPSARVPARPGRPALSIARGESFEFQERDEATPFRAANLKRAAGPSGRATSSLMRAKARRGTKGAAGRPGTAGPRRSAACGALPPSRLGAAGLGSTALTSSVTSWLPAWTALVFCIGWPGMPLAVLVSSVASDRPRSRHGRLTVEERPGSRGHREQEGQGPLPAVSRGLPRGG